MDNRDEEMYNDMYMGAEEDIPGIGEKLGRMKLVTFIIIIAILAFVLVFFADWESQKQKNLRSASNTEVQTFVINNTVPDTGSIIQE